MNKIQKAAKKLYKQLKGNVTFEAVEAHLKKIGYRILFFNAPLGDGELQRYRLLEKAQKTKAFTYCASAKIIFINNDLSVEDKFYLLLHEVAHIVLKHLEPGKISMSNGILLDIDADAFVYYLLNPQPYSHKNTVVGIAVACISAGALFYNPATDVNTVPTSSITTQPRNIVYITSTGDHFHCANCGTITGRNVAQISRTEALKIHEPCSMCNP